MSSRTRFSLFFAAALILLLAAAAPAFAADWTTQTLTPGNPQTDYKIDPVPFGTSDHPFTVGGEDVVVRITVYATDPDVGPMMDWAVIEGNVVVDTVICKGGRDGAYVYTYVPGATSDTGLYCPENPSGKYADFSHIDFWFSTGGGGGDKAELCGSKWYDRDKDGVWDEGEPGIEGWKISLYKLVDEAYVWVEDTLTDEDGAYCFSDLEPGTYKVAEGAASGSWVQTFPYDPDYYDEIELSAGMSIDELDFGNVCVREAKGYTMGFWSNKNGAAALAAAGYKAVEIKDIQATFKSAANAVDMCVMLKAQALAHYLNTTVEVGGKTADYTGTGVIIDDEVWEYDAVMADVGEFDCDQATRAEAEWYKDFFDGLNNNWFPLVSWDPCDLPTWD
jgi:hypothetical protein